MIKLAKVLYPTDFSELSLNALRYAKSLAGAFEADLHCLHVVDEAYQYWMAMGPNTVPVGPVGEDMLESGNQQMEEFAKKHLSDYENHHTTVLMGRPFVEIVRYAREQAIDLIVIATHGRGGLAHVLLGSTTEKVVRKAPCPVLTVRHAQHEFILP